MPPYNFLTADVFTDRVFGGNPLAVFPDGRGLSAEQMAAIAREFNLSETVFAFPPEDPANTRKVRIFTPGGELPFAGHPTVGAALMLAEVGEIALDGEETRIRLEEGVGVVPVTIRARDGKPVFAELTAAMAPEEGPDPPPVADIAAAISLDASDLVGGEWSPRAFTCGVRYLFVPVRDRERVARARVLPDRWEATLSRYWAPEIFVFSRDASDPSAPIHARMFAPGLSVPEDPATGSAAAALAGYLCQRQKQRDGMVRWTIEQGVEMGRPSTMHLEADLSNGKITAVRVGGGAVMVMRGSFLVPETAGAGHTPARAAKQRT